MWCTESAVGPFLIVCHSILYLLATEQSHLRSKFISVEIALHSNDDSSEWIAWFRALDNHVTKKPGTCAKWFIFFAPLSSGDVDSTIRTLCTEIAGLPEHIRTFWTNATRREFFLGYQSGNDWPCLEDRLSCDTLKLIVGLNAELRIAIYPSSHE